jgi:hypothetical protein
MAGSWMEAAIAADQARRKKSSPSIASRAAAPVRAVGMAERSVGRGFMAAARAVANPRSGGAGKYRRGARTGTSGSRSAGANRNRQAMAESAAGRARLRSMGLTNVHYERDRPNSYAGTVVNSYGSSPSGRSVSRSQGARRRATPHEEQLGYDPRTMGNRRYGAGATAPASRTNPSRRIPLRSNMPEDDRSGRYGRGNHRVY